MKKSLLLLLTLTVCVFTYGQDLKVLTWSNNGLPLQHSYENALIDSIRALPQVASVDTIGTQADWEAFETTGFDDYDVVVILESGSSSASQFYGTMGFPKPLITFEPWVLHKSGWEWYVQDEGFFAANGLGLDYREAGRYTEVIETPDHPVFNGMGFSKDDEVVFSDGADDLADSENDGDCYGIDLDVAIDDIANSATPLANCLFALENDDVFGSAVNMWAIEENNTSPRIFLYGQHAADLQFRSDNMYKLLQNATLWVAGLDDLLLAAEDVNQAANVKAYLSADNQIVIEGLKNSASVSICNVAGQEVFCSRNNITQIDFNAYPNGIYLISVIADNGDRFTAKIFK